MSSHEIFKSLRVGYACPVCRKSVPHPPRPGHEVCADQGCVRAWLLLTGREPRCEICRVLLNQAERATGAVCSAQECRHHAAMSNAHLHAMAKKAARQAEARAMWQEVGDKNGTVLPQNSLLAIVPFNLHSVVELSENDLEEFRKQLWFTISNAFAHHPETPTSLPDENHGEDYIAPVAKKLGNCCATCGGWCCLQGAGHAFIEENTIHRYRYYHPGATAEMIFEDYISRIGADAYLGSCVYHSLHGCRLPRELRAAMCNQFRCRGLIDLLSQIESNPSGTGIVAAADEHCVRAVGPLDDSCGAHGIAGAS